jgi:serine/threonine protein kinase
MVSPDLPLSPDDRAVLSMRADEFNVALNHGSTNDWNPFLEGLTGPVRLAVLTELAVLDLVHRFESGDQPTLSEYVGRYPELGPPGSEPAALVREYERCRANAEPSVRTTQFRATLFPEEVQPTRTVLASGPPKIATGGFGGGDGLVAVAQNYELIRELGRGAFGEVWLALKMPSGIEKAVKILHQPADQDAAQRELRSLELIKNLRHPYLLATEDFWVANNRLFIVTELADTSLRKRLVDCKDEGLPAIPIEELFPYIHEAAEGFDYLHMKMITHRDVKPDNILLVNGHAKVADFGLARHHDSNVAQMSFAGTPAYMAPEVWGGEGGPPSDLYGFAMSYVELRQGSTPFKSGKVMEVMQAHLGGAFEFAEMIGPAEAAVLRRSLARDPQERHPSCLAFAEDLADALGRAIHRKSGAVPSPRPRPLPDSAAASVDTNLTKATVRAPAPTATPAKSRLPKKALAGIFAGLLLAIGIVAAIASRGDRPDGGTPDDSGRGGDPNAVIAPRGTTVESDARVIDVAGHGRVAEWVVAERGGQKVRFRLIAPTGANTVPPFFISQSKVWNSLYRAGGNDQHPEMGGADAPVMNVAANEAAAFAAQFEGRLPRPDEWDHAAGFFDRKGQEGPLRPGSSLAVGSIPAPTHGEQHAPMNQYDLIDMAGNGREWTCTVLPAEGQASRIVEGPSFQPKDFVVLRGRSYTLKTPLSYGIMERELKDPQAQYAGVASPYTGFRIVLPLPK